MGLLVGKRGNIFRVKKIKIKKKNRPISQAGSSKGTGVASCDEQTCTGKVDLGLWGKKGEEEHAWLSTRVGSVGGSRR